ncbi:MAG: alpha/beta fold hydrolase [Pigmentiphaga sp.]|uniref:alpha/beta fold hydrolase n=1 Tax=Pigmentiphaga sp. TaxID=1977564 RepID=UPI0029B9FD5B|nr:alpha/beta fold hydrolase [Pigmentiphaga sp.]MDX3905075.1 alpha/beta fold hydrolase [Pigmentiphaga sp.]
MARLPLVLVHGWGFDASVWDALRAHLPGWTLHAADAGYFGEAVAEPRPPAYVAVGHSLGAMRCLATTDRGCRGWVLINGFTRFSAADDFPAGVPVRVIDRMVSKLATDPAAVVNEFRRRCGAAPAAGVPNAAALAADLLQLRNGDARKEWAQRRIPVCVLAGEADPVVAPALTRASFGTSVAWQPDGGHLLPLTHPAWCAQRIRDFAGTCAATDAIDPA